MSKVKILFVAADPVDTHRLQLDDEFRQITRTIRASEYRDSFELVSRWAVRLDDLFQAVLEERPQIVHFSGHAHHSESLILMDEAGRGKQVPKETLVQLFRTQKSTVRIVVFNTGMNKPLAEAVAGVVDCVVGMNGEIGDQAAIVFAAWFYRGLGSGRSVQEAFDQGRLALSMEDIPEADTPELHARAGVDPSALFLLAGQPGPAAIAAGPKPAPQDQPARPLPPMNRVTLVKTLANLSTSDFDMLVAAIDGAGGQVGRHGTVREKAADLLRWADSSKGCGIPVIEEALSIFH